MSGPSKPGPSKPGPNKQGPFKPRSSYLDSSDDDREPTKEDKEATRKRVQADKERAQAMQDRLDHEERIREARAWDEQQRLNPVPNPLLLPRGRPK